MPHTSRWNTYYEERYGQAGMENLGELRIRQNLHEIMKPQEMAMSISWKTWLAMSQNLNTPGNQK
jgi:hypothetical protein